jgi:small acid-soluble spore protein E (minor gamma-type SASP)
MSEEFGSETDVNEVRRQNQQSQQGMSNQQSFQGMNEEFASETDVNEVRRQNQQSEANKNASGMRANRNRTQ